MPAPDRPSRLSAFAEVVREAFWIIALGLIAAYAFFVALGAYSPGDVLGVTVAIGVLAALWLVHAWSRSHRSRGGRDPRVTSARERRGF
jgi:membrane protein implicated in regulation of membrane protease activity